MKLLLVNPKVPESFWSFRWVAEAVFSEKRTGNPPLGLATLAALCPESWDVEIVDENIESVPLQPEADIVGVCGMGVQLKRQTELLAFYREKGYHVVAGGSYASLCPELYEPLADTVVAGEAEYIWQEFCRDFEAGTPQGLYRETGTVDLSDSPVPRFDLLKLDKYHSVSLQFSRGCPFLCEFCDIIVMFGRKPRAKSTEQVGRELDVLRKFDVHHLFFVDDNLIGNKRFAKDLMRFLVRYQEEHDYRFHFGTQLSIDFSQDDELLRLAREAGFDWVFIGIESPEEESLKETRKLQNTRGDLLSSIRKIYSNGIQVLGGFIIGFDHDTVEIFEKQERFITESGIQTAMVGLLVAAPRTPLYQRLEKEGRLVAEADSSDNTKLGSNIIPAGMSYDEMISGYRALLSRLVQPRSIADRIRKKTRFFIAPPAREGYSPRETSTILRRFLLRGLLPGGLRRIYHFIRSMPITRPQLVPLVLQDWIMGLSMRDYVERHFVRVGEGAKHSLQDSLRSIQAAFSEQLRHGVLEISFGQVTSTASNLSVSLKGFLDRDFFRRASRHLEKLLEETTSTVTLRIEELHESQVQHFHRLLKRLSRHGDRISIAVHDELKGIVHIDSSVFHLVLIGT
ncbi:MAG: radical SAM protein [Bacteroidota bacterium]